MPLVFDPNNNSISLKNFHGERINGLRSVRHTSGQYAGKFVLYPCDDKGLVDSNIAPRDHHFKMLHSKDRNGKSFRTLSLCVNMHTDNFGKPIYTQHFDRTGQIVSRQLTMPEYRLAREFGSKWHILEKDGSTRTVFNIFNKSCPPSYSRHASGDYVIEFNPHAFQPSRPHPNRRRRDNHRDRSGTHVANAFDALADGDTDGNSPRRTEPTPVDHAPTTGSSYRNALLTAPKPKVVFPNEPTVDSSVSQSESEWEAKAPALSTSEWDDWADDNGENTVPPRSQWNTPSVSAWDD